MRLGELLISNGLITEAELKQALKQQVNSNKKLGEILIESGEITERQLVEVLEFQLGIPVVNMKEATFEKTAIQLIHESVARKYNLIPMDQKGGKIRIAMIDPLNHEAIKQIQLLTGWSVLPLLITPSELQEAITQYYGVTETTGELNQIIQSAVQQKATSIHLIPEENGLAVKFQILNALHKQKVIPKDNQEALIHRIKILFNLNTEEHRLPQEGHYLWQPQADQLNLRISILPTVSGEHFMIRIMNPPIEIQKITDLDLTENNIHRMKDLIQRPSGMILVAGPSPSDKTSALYSIIHELNNDELNIISVEDPVGRHIKGTTQVEVNQRIGFTLVSAMQAALYRNPDILMVGHIDDRQSAELAAKASLSGRRTICGCQGNNTGDAIRRMLELGMDAHLLAASLSGIIVQRQARQVCKHCTQSTPATDEEMKIFETHQLLDLDKGNKSVMKNFRTYLSSQISGKITVFRGKGCNICNNTGYSGWVAIHEVLPIDKKMKELIAKSLPEAEFEQYLKEKDDKSILYDGLLKAREGKTTVEEVMKVV